MIRHNRPLSPLQVLLITMQRRWDAEDTDGAAEIARHAAPYVHARRTATPARRAQQEPDRLTDAELDTALREAGAGVALPPSAAPEPDDLG